ncbi:MAG: hypothetical protein K5766_02885 [Alphaproteobacteria bacterium]|nr:hypothetical protein [Alphaproteobacteria bacterium]
MLIKQRRSKIKPRRFSTKNYGERIGSGNDRISVCVFPHLDNCFNGVLIFEEKCRSFRLQIEIYSQVSKP